VSLPPSLDRPALITIDMHRGSLDPPGTVFVPNGRAIVPALAGLLDAARDADVPVIHIVHQIDPSGADARSPFWLEAESVGDLYPNVREQVIGSAWTELVPELGPEPGDHVLPKKRYGAFSGNGLGFLLKNLGVATLVLTGVETEICILATAYHAFNEDYRVVVARDGVAAFDGELGDAALRIIEREVGWVATCAEIGAALAHVSVA